MTASSGSAWTAGSGDAFRSEKCLPIPRLDPPLLPGLEVEQVELRDARLGQPERHSGAEREALGPHGAKQQFEVILRRPPDPRDVPENPRRLGGRRADTEQLDEVTDRVG